MLLDEKVEVSLGSRRIKYYESLGYEIPKYKDKQNRLKVKKGTKLLIDIKDLPFNSNLEVNVKCDNCEKKYLKQYYKHTKYNDGLDYCIDCRFQRSKITNLKKYGVDNASKTDESRRTLSVNRRKDFESVKITFEDMGYTLVDKEYVRYDKPMRFICNEHPEIGVQESSYDTVRKGHKSCSKCYYESRSGKNSHFWQGGKTPINHHFRSEIKEWKQDSLEYYGFKCFLTGNKDDLVVHHVVNFSNILEDTFNELNIDVKDSIGDYSNEELDLIKETLINNHYFYGFGIPMNKDLHYKFHSLYGRENNTYEQLIEFKNTHLEVS